MSALAEIRNILLRHGIPEVTASLILAEIGQSLGGQRLYFGVKPRSEYADRNAEIIRQFKGNNVLDLADDYDLTPRQVRRIVRPGKK